MNTMMMRRVPGHGGCAAVCVPLSEVAAMPPHSGAGDQGLGAGGGRVESKAWAVLEKRMARRDVEVGILSEMAEERLTRSDYDGFRRLADLAWKRRCRNWRVGVWMFRQCLERAAVVGGGVA